MALPKPAVVENSADDSHLYHKEAKDKLDKQSLDYVVRSGIAGGAAGCAAKTLIAPLDRVKILFQTSNPQFRRYTSSWLGFYKAGREIYRNCGALALFQGHSATLLRIFPYAAIKFVSYEQVRSLFIRNKSQETSARRFLSGSVSGLISVFCTYPLDLVRVRLAYDTSDEQASRRGRLIRIVKKVYSERDGRGMINFYRGFVPTIFGMIPYAGVSFWAHDIFHDIFRSKLLAPYAVSDSYHPRSSHSKRPLQAWAQLTAGGLSGMCAQTASYPFEVIRRRMQVGGAVNERQGMLATARNIVNGPNGARGLFVGLTIGYIKVIPMFACSFFVYERAKLWLGI
uniref:ARAD1D13002p n=1 Tax=Blastobotrys adeninivorans TaxID=409370 RepID=A0A060T957_BLAAD